MAGIPQFGNTIMNIQIGQFARCPLDNNAIEAGKFQESAERSIGLAESCSAGQTSFGCNRESAAPRYSGAAQRA